MSRRTVFGRLRALLLLAPLLLLTGCSKVSGLGYEEGLSSVNDQSLSLWQGAWIAGGVVGVITLILILWPAVFHRGKKNDPSFPKQIKTFGEQCHFILPFFARSFHIFLYVHIFLCTNKTSMNNVAV